MEDLLRVRAKAAEESAKKGKKIRKKKKTTVTYGAGGKVKRGKTPTWAKVIIGILTFFLLVALFIYIPPLFYNDAVAKSYTPIMPDSTAIKTYQTYLKDHPEADFDEDGMDNSHESDYGTDVWKVDSDGDGVSDYAELFLTETSPTDASTIMIKQVTTEDEKRGDTLGSPYKLDDILFWPDDYQSKAYGAVVKLSQSENMIAYRFCYFKGWVRFPYPGVYAYGYRDGKHYELPRKADQEAWQIQSSDEVRIYTSPLEFVHCLKLPFVGKLYFDDTSFGRFLTKALPDKGGFVNCYKAAIVDEEPKVREDVTATLRLPLIDREDASRFGRNQNSLKDLSWVRKVIEADNCVAVSFYSANTGESIGLVYGYTKEGNLLIANESLEPVGEIEILPKAMRMMDKDGEVGFRQWYDWRGLGFDSMRFGDRISFFGSTLSEVKETDETNAALQDEKQYTPVQPQTEPQTQSQETEPETKPSTEAQTEAKTEANDTVVTFGL